MVALCLVSPLNGIRCDCTKVTNNSNKYACINFRVPYLSSFAACTQFERNFYFLTLGESFISILLSGLHVVLIILNFAEKTFMDHKPNILNA